MAASMKGRASPGSARFPESWRAALADSGPLAAIRHPPHPSSEGPEKPGNDLLAPGLAALSTETARASRPGPLAADLIVQRIDPRAMLQAKEEDRSPIGTHGQEHA